MQVRYEIFYENGSLISTSEDEHGGGPFHFELGGPGVLDGLNKATFVMCIGEIREAIIPPKLAWGSTVIEKQVCKKDRFFNFVSLGPQSNSPRHHFENACGTFEH